MKKGLIIIDEEYKKQIYGYQPTKDKYKDKGERPKPPRGGNIAQNK